MPPQWSRCLCQRVGAARLRRSHRCVPVLLTAALRGPAGAPGAHPTRSDCRGAYRQSLGRRDGNTHRYQRWRCFGFAGFLLGHCFLQRLNKITENERDFSVSPMLAVLCGVRRPRATHGYLYCPRKNYPRGMLAESSGDFWQRLSLELLDGFACLTDRSGSRPTVRIQPAPPISLSLIGHSRELSEIRAWAAICLRMRTQREASRAQIGQNSRILSARDFPMSDPMRSMACRVGAFRRRTFALLSATKSAESASHLSSQIAFVFLILPPGHKCLGCSADSSAYELRADSPSLPTPLTQNHVESAWVRRTYI
jgi:hypothetical protein